MRFILIHRGIGPQDLTGLEAGRGHPRQALVTFPPSFPKQRGQCSVCHWPVYYMIKVQIKK